MTGAGYSVPDDGVVMFFTMPAQQEVYVTIGGHTILHKGNTSGNYAVATCPIVKKGEKFWAGLFSGGTAFFFPFKKEKTTNAYFIKY